MPKLLTLGEVGRVLEQLPRERVSIRDFGAILEAMLETAPLSKSTEALVEAARQAMGRRLRCSQLLDGDGQLPVLLLDAPLEEEILSTVSPDAGQRLLSSVRAGNSPRRLVDSLKSLIVSASPAAPPVSLCPVPPVITFGAGSSRSSPRAWPWLQPGDSTRGEAAAWWERCGEAVGDYTSQGTRGIRMLDQGYRCRCRPGSSSQGAASGSYPPSGSDSAMTPEQERILLEHLPVVRFLARRTTSGCRSTSISKTWFRRAW